MNYIPNKVIIVCPFCKGSLVKVSGGIRCDHCDFIFSDLGGGCFDMMPPGFGTTDGTNWGDRLKEMEDWYQDFLAEPSQAASALAHDYEPLAGALGELRGSVLDVGGGVGLTREYLADGVLYVDVDPSLSWLAMDGARMADRFPTLGHRFQFIRGIGEYLPFAPSSFDAAVSCWSLNHASEPRKVFDEVYRVLKPGGRFIAVLEDMAPQWRDIMSKTAKRSAERMGRARGTRANFFPGSVKEALSYKLLNKPWPLQHDHIRIREAEIKQWIKGHFLLLKRDWKGGFLTYDLIRI